MPALPANLQQMKVVLGYHVGPNDVFCGHRMNWSGGNKRLGELVNQNLERYNKAEMDKKSEIASEVLRHILDHGGKFLKEDKGKVVTLTPKEAKTKIMQKFRDTKKAMNQKSDTPPASKKERKNGKRRSTSQSPPGSDMPPLQKTTAMIEGALNHTTNPAMLMINQNHTGVVMSAMNPAFLKTNPNYSSGKKARRMLPLASKKSPSNSEDYDMNSTTSSTDSPVQDMPDEEPRASKAAPSQFEDAPESDDEGAQTKVKADGLDHSSHSKSQFEDAKEDEPAKHSPAIMPRLGGVKSIEEAAKASDPNASVVDLSGDDDSKPAAPSTTISGMTSAQMLAAAANLQSNNLNNNLNSSLYWKNNPLNNNSPMWQQQQQQMPNTNPTQMLPLMLQQQQHMVARQQIVLQENQKKIKLLEHVLALRDQEILNWHGNIRDMKEASTIKDREIQKLREALMFVTTKMAQAEGEAEGKEEDSDTPYRMVLSERVAALTKAAAYKDEEILKLKQELVADKQQLVAVAELGLGKLPATMDYPGDPKIQEIQKLREAVSITKDQLDTLTGAEALKDLTIAKLKEEIAVKDKRLLVLEHAKGKVLGSLKTAQTGATEDNGSAAAADGKVAAVEKTEATDKKMPAVEKLLAAGIAVASGETTAAAAAAAGEEEHEEEDYMFM